MHGGRRICRQVTLHAYACTGRGDPCRSPRIIFPDLVIITELVDLPNGEVCYDFGVRVRVSLRASEASKW